MAAACALLGSNLHGNSTSNACKNAHHTLKRRLSRVYSCPQKSAVSSPSARTTWKFSAICAALPSKKEPQPPANKVSPVNRHCCGPFELWWPLARYITWPRVWQGAFKHCTSMDPMRSVSLATDYFLAQDTQRKENPPFTSLLANGTLSEAPPTTTKPGNLARSASLPPAWSQCLCVVNTCYVRER